MKTNNPFVENSVKKNFLEKLKIVNTWSEDKINEHMQELTNCRNLCFSENSSGVLDAIENLEKIIFQNKLNEIYYSLLGRSLLSYNYNCNLSRKVKTLISIFSKI